MKLNVGDIVFLKNLVDDTLKQVEEANDEKYSDFEDFIGRLSEKLDIIIKKSETNENV